MVKDKSVSKKEISNWKNLKKRLVGLTVVERNKKPYLLMVVKLPSKGGSLANIPDILKKAMLLTGRAGVAISPNITVLGVMITKKLVEDMAKYYSAYQQPENIKKSPMTVFKETFPDYVNSYSFWNNYITNPLLASVAIGAVGNMTKAPILSDHKSAQVKKFLKDGLEKLAMATQMTPVSYRTTFLQGPRKGLPLTGQYLKDLVKGEMETI